MKNDLECVVLCECFLKSNKYLAHKTLIYLLIICYLYVIGVRQLKERRPELAQFDQRPGTAKGQRAVC